MSASTKKVLAILIASSLGLLGATSSHASTEIIQEEKPLDECISKQHKLSVLFLVDESISLTKNKKNPKGTDPKNLRVKALQASATALASLANGDKQDRIDVEASIAGFGDGYTPHQDWMSLDSETISDFSLELAKQAQRNTDFHTRYNEAMKGAVASFEKSTNDGDSCRLLIWFSDGQHDYDDVRGLSKFEKRQISYDLCRSGGYVDQLRENGVFIQAVGLNDSSQAMELMKIIAVRDGLFKSDGLTLTRCGEQPGIGKFTWVNEADGLIDALISGEPVHPNQCADGTPECYEFIFQVDETVSRFRFLVTTPETGVNSTVVTAGEGDSFSLFEGEEKHPIDVVTATSLTSTKVLLDVLREKGESIEGHWKIRFLGPNASAAIGKVSFVGDTTLRIMDGTDKPLRSIDRFKTTGLTAKLSRVSEGSRIQAIEFTFKYLQEEQKIIAQSIGNNSFKVEKNAIAQLLSNSGKFASVGSVDISALPLGYVLGLKDEKGDDVSISYHPTFLHDVQITDGDQQPIVKSILGADGKRLEFKGTTKRTAYFTFAGADAADTKVEFSSGDQSLTRNPKKFTVIEQKECVVPRGREKTCQVDIKPEVKGYGPYGVPLTITYTNKTSSETKKISHVASVNMKTEPPVGPGIRRAIELLALFLLVQGSLRAGFAILMTRFARLNGTSRRGRIPVSIDSSGRISPRGSAQFALIDDGYAIENSESVREFDLFGIRFSCSPLRTFLKSTVTPIGQASAADTHVFGSSSSRMSNDLSIGLVNLALRNQWVLRVSRNEIESLANGTSSISGEVVAFFDPYDFKHMDGQMQSLGTSIVSSAVPESIREIVEVAKNKSETHEKNDLKVSVDHQSDNSSVNKNPFNVTATSSIPNASMVSSEVEKPKKQKKNKKKDVSPSVEPPSENKPRNPFAN